MHVLVYGAGAVGGYFGARLATGRHDVTLIARGANLAALRANGLRVDLAPTGETLHVHPIRAVIPARDVHTRAAMPRGFFVPRGGLQ